jgi:hypothetical protein
VLLASVTCQDDEGKKYVSAKGEYLERKREFDDSGMYINFAENNNNNVHVNLEPPT